MMSPIRVVFLVFFCRNAVLSSVQAQVVAYSDAKEVQSLAKNIDTAIQACGRHTSRFHRSQGQALIESGIDLTDEAPEGIKKLASASTFGASRYHRWFDPHAEIWLIASKDKPSCRIAISNSQWVGAVGPELATLVQVGNAWRPAKEGESPTLPNPDGPSMTNYFMDLPATMPIRPFLTVLAARPGIVLSGNQQMIITLLTLLKD